MPGVPRELAEHTLNIDPKFKHVRQFLWRFNEERRKAIGEEVARLLAAGFIVEVFHPEWLANPVLVLKKNGTWRMCVDYTEHLAPFFIEPPEKLANRIELWIDIKSVLSEFPRDTRHV